MNMNDRVSTLALPDSVKRHLTSACEGVITVSAERLSALVLYGSAATGKFVSGTSDINLLILFKESTPALLRAIGPHLRAGFRSVRLEPLLLTERELIGGADVFPTKFKDIATTHVVLHGDPSFAALKFSREHIRLRVEQELRNLSLRFRRRYAVHAGSDESLRADITSTVSAFAAELRHLLELFGTAVPPSAALTEVFSAAASKLDLPKTALDVCAALHDRPDAALAGVDEAAVGLLEALARAAELADALPEAT